MTVADPTIRANPLRATGTDVVPPAPTVRRGAGLAAIALPRAAALTDLLNGEGGPNGDRPCPREVDAVRRRLELGLAPGAGRCPRQPWRITRYLLRTALVAPGRLGELPAFRWSAATARRRIGLVAVRACVAGSARTPAEAVADAVATLAAEGHHGIGRAGSLTEWVGRLPAPVLAVVRAEATTWATRLWTAVDWERLRTGVQVGGPGERWSPASLPAMSLVSQADVAAVGIDDEEALLTVLPGSPGPSSRSELGLAALVTALARSTSRDGRRPARRAGVPGRVAGWWPDCGRALVVSVDLPLLEETAEAVLRTATSLAEHAGSGRPGDRDGAAGR